MTGTVFPLRRGFSLEGVEGNFASLKLVDVEHTSDLWPAFE